MFRKSSEKTIARVRTYSGFRADERPDSFRIGSLTHFVSRIRDRHRERNQNGDLVEVFVVTTRREREFLLEHLLRNDKWFAAEIQRKSG